MTKDNRYILLNFDKKPSASNSLEKLKKNKDVILFYSRIILIKKLLKQVVDLKILEDRSQKIIINQ